MLDSVPVPFQAILWPLFGATVVLALGRLLPYWARQLLAVLSAVASFAVLWSLREVAPVQTEILWEPLNLFRMSPVLVPDGLSLAIGLTLAGVTTAALVGIRDREAQGATWHGLLLITLAGCLTMVMAGSLLALALASTLVDLSLVFLAVSSRDGREAGGNTRLAVTIPGIASTLAILLGAIQMDAQAGHGSLLSQTSSPEALVLLGIAAVLRSFVYPLYPRHLHKPESAIALLLPVSAGLYLLARVQSLLPVLSAQPWLVALSAVALLAGGLLAWSRAFALEATASVPAGFGRFWIGSLVQQTGYALTFFLLLAGVQPWPLISLMLALAALIIWWAEPSGEASAPARSRTLEHIRQWLAPRRTRAASVAGEVPARTGHWHDSRFAHFAVALLPLVSVASLIGAPLTAGARGRWPLYAALLKRGDGSLLVALVADTLLVAGLAVGLTITLKQAGEHRPRPLALLAAGVLVLAIVLLGLAPGLLGDGLGLAEAEPAEVSAWGLGLLYVLPWLLGVWLARIRRILGNYLVPIESVVSLDWCYRVVGWVGQRLVDAIYWLGRVGEGEGWWGWALIVLTLGVLLLAAR
jgi:hypothetical protein